MAATTLETATSKLPVKEYWALPCWHATHIHLNVSSFKLPITSESCLIGLKVLFSSKIDYKETNISAERMMQEKVINRNKKKSL
jgi:hypothetical protein